VQRQQTAPPASTMRLTFSRNRLCAAPYQFSTVVNPRRCGGVVRRAGLRGAGHDRSSHHARTVALIGFDEIAGDVK